MNDSRKELLIVTVAAVALLAVFSGCGGPPSNAERTTTKAGPISQMSSMLGPDSSGKPRTQRPADASTPPK